MKLETLAKRLAEKTDTPVLEDVILGHREISELPSTCMVWTGAKTRKERSDWQLELIRGGTGYLSAQMVQRNPYAKIKYQGVSHLVSRLMIKLLIDPPYQFRMRQTCSTPLCVNPLHWELNPVEKKKVIEVPEAPEIETGWTLESTVEMLELILEDVPPPSSWEEVINHIDMEGAPEHLVRTGLIQINKEHLTV